MDDDYVDLSPHDWSLEEDRLEYRLQRKTSERFKRQKSSQSLSSAATHQLTNRKAASASTVKGSARDRNSSKRRGHHKPGFKGVAKAKQRTAARARQGRRQGAHGGSTHQSSIGWAKKRKGGTRTSQLFQEWPYCQPVSDSAPTDTESLVHVDGDENDDEQQRRRASFSSKRQTSKSSLASTRRQSSKSSLLDAENDLPSLSRQNSANSIASSSRGSHASSSRGPHAFARTPERKHSANLKQRRHSSPHALSRKAFSESLPSSKRRFDVREQAPCILGFSESEQDCSSQDDAVCDLDTSSSGRYDPGTDDQASFQGSSSDPDEGGGVEETFEDAKNEIYRWMDSWSSADGVPGDTVLDFSSLDLTVAQLHRLLGMFDKALQVPGQVMVLNLGKNKLAAIPEQVAHLKSLTELLLFSNSLGGSPCLPSNIGNLESLTTLSMSGNLLKTIPPEIASLPSLKRLDLNRNMIMHIDHDAMEVFRAIAKSLQVLNLGFNNLTAIPGSFCLVLSKLERLYIQVNKIDKLPQEIQHMTSLTTLRASGNPLQNPPPATVEKGIVAIRDYFSTMQSEGSCKVNPPTPRLNPMVAHIQVPFGDLDLDTGVEQFQQSPQQVRSPHLSPVCRALVQMSRHEGAPVTDRRSTISIHSILGQTGARSRVGSTGSACSESAGSAHSESAGSAHSESAGSAHSESAGAIRIGSPGPARPRSRGSARPRSRESARGRSPGPARLRSPQAKALGYPQSIERRPPQSMTLGSPQSVPLQAAMLQDRESNLFMLNDDSSHESATLDGHMRQVGDRAHQRLGDFPARDGPPPFPMPSSEATPPPQTLLERIQTTQRLTEIDGAAHHGQLRVNQDTLPRDHSTTAPPEYVSSVEPPQAETLASADVLLNPQFKVVVVGAAHAGKTSLIRTLLQGTPQPVCASDSRTLGIDIYEASLNLRNNRFVWQQRQKVTSREGGNPNTSSGELNEPLTTRRFLVWDFAGQGVYQSTHQCFLSSRALYLLVWDINKHTAEEMDEAVFFWVYSIQARVPEAVIQIVATKTETVSRAEVDARFQRLEQRRRDHEKWRCRDLMLQEEMHEKHHQIMSRVKHYQMQKQRHAGGMFPMRQSNSDGYLDGESKQLNRVRELMSRRPRVQLGFIPVSSVNYSGFDVLRDSVVQMSCNVSLFPHVGSLVEIPNPWSLVAKAVEVLRAERKPFVNWATLMECVRRVMSNTTITQIPSPQAVAACLEWLNDVGDIVHNIGINNLPGDNDPHPKGLIFLDPNWLVSIIKRLVNDKFRRGDATRRASSNQDVHPYVMHQAWKNLENGILSEVLIAELWPELFRTGGDSNATVSSLMQVLLQFDVCYEVNPKQVSIPERVETEWFLGLPRDSGAPPRLWGKTRETKTYHQWFVPCLLTESLNRASFPWASVRLPEDKIDFSRPVLSLYESCADRCGSRRSEIEICRRITFERFVPPGVIGRILHALHKHQVAKDNPSVYADGAVFRFQAEGRPYHQSFDLVVHLRQDDVCEDILAPPNPDYDSDDYYAGAYSETQNKPLPTSTTTTTSNPANKRPGVGLEISAIGDVRGIERMWKSVIRVASIVEEVVSSYDGLKYVVEVPCPCCLNILPDDQRDSAGTFSLLNLDEAAVNFSWTDVRYPDVQTDASSCVSSTWTDHTEMDDRVVVYLKDLFKNAVPCNAHKQIKGVVAHQCPKAWVIPPPETKNADQENYRANEYPLRLSQDTVLDARAIVRVAVYHRASGQFLQGGTGFVVDRKAGLIVTAGHMLTCPEMLPARHVRWYKGTETGEVVAYPKRDCLVVIGLYDKQDETPEWSFCADVVKYAWVVDSHGNQVNEDPPESGTQEAVTYTNEDMALIREVAGSSMNSFVDAAILRVYATCKVEPHAFRGQGGHLSTFMGVHSLFDKVRITPKPGANQDQVLTLPAELAIGDSSTVTLNDQVTLPGYPAEYGESLCVDTARINMIPENTNALRTNAFQHSGSSGGPLLANDGRVVGIMSKSVRGMGEHVAINAVREEIQHAMRMSRRGVGV